MIRQIDHLVIISADLDTAIANARTAGFTVVPGGTHGDGRTHNALIAFRDGTYIELIAPTSEDALQGDHRWFPRLRRGGGLVDFCLFGDKLDAEAAAIRERGVDYPAPNPMARNRPDGVRLEWTLSTPPGAVGETGWPFLIEDITPRDLRVPHDANEITHQNGAIGVAGVTVLVHDLDAAKRDYEAILGTTGREMTAPFSDDRLGVIFPVGEKSAQWVMLVEPNSHEATDHLEQHGQGPYRALLRTREGAIAPGEGDYLDPELFSGARLLLA
ncbi:MAG TPA: VOC family protein [Thermomicrobiales bacterium]|nr:VOC family protein [Thermomicrobiales bacterium]